MGTVTSSRQKLGNRLANGMIVVALIVFLAPIYWIGSTAFKPRNLATTVPMTILFQPEVSPFVKLFTKRVQLKPNEQVDYENAPWWEKIVIDGGERISRSGKGEVQLSGYPSRFLNSLIVAVTSTFLAVAMGTITAYGFSRFKVAGEADWLFFILSTRMLPPVVVAIPMFLLPVAIFTFRLRNHLLRGMSFGAIRK